MSLIRTIVQLLSLSALCNCSLFGRKGNWGRDAVWPIKGSRIGAAFVKNISSAHVWAPLAGAGITYFGGYDQKISDWAVEKRYVYNNLENTSFWSDRFNDIQLYEMYLNILLSPSMDEDESLLNYSISKGKGALVTNLATRGADYTRDEMALFFKRQRPNKLDNKSFPSGHSTQACSRNTLNRKIIDTMDWNYSFKAGVNAINHTMAAGTLWARLEGQRHYPSDILVGYAVGTFITGFIYDSLMNVDQNETITVSPTGRDEVSAMYTIRF